MLKFVVRFLVVSLFLYVARDLLSFCYQGLLYILLLLLGFADVTSPPYESSYRLIPLLALILATPALQRRKKVLGIGVGLLLFLLLDLVSSILWGGPPSRMVVQQGTTTLHYAYSLGWDLAGHWVMPLLVWMVVAHDQIVSFARSYYSSR